MDVKLHSQSRNFQGKITITGSKSETNRLLLLKALYPSINISNVSESDDSAVMQQALLNKKSVIDVHHAGTAMRFLTAFFAIKESSEVVITGSDRMKERPIKILVGALQNLGAKIEYLGEEGFPPLKIYGTKIIKNKVTLRADISSQYISALLLIASSLENGLELTLKGNTTSLPYINMTLSLLSEVGIKSVFSNNTIFIKPVKTLSQSTYTIESDWSSASYFYSIVALSENSKIELSYYKKNSYQGDTALAEIYKLFGVETVYNDNSIILLKNGQFSANTEVVLNLKETPDIAQTIAVTCFGLGIGCCLEGLHTLKIKETDRLLALQVELEKLGAKVSVSNDSLILETSNTINSNIAINTYNDHRMAMAFAPLALITEIVICDAEVVSKSYPHFWEDLNHLGINVAW